MFKLLKKMNREGWIQIAISVVFVVAQVWLDLKIPDYMTQITKLIQSNSEVSEVWTAGGKMLTCALASLISAVAVGFFSSKMSAGFSQKIRSLLFRKVNAFSMEEINKFSTASLITRSTNDITQIQMLLSMSVQMIVKVPIIIVFALMKIISKGYEWSLATAITMGIMIIFMGGIMVVLMPKFKQMQALTDNLNGTAREKLTGLRVVRAFNAEKYQDKKFEKANDELTKTQLITNRGMALLAPAMTMMMNVFNIVIYIIGANLILKIPGEGLTTFSNMVVFSAYALQIMMAVIMLVMIFTMLPRALVSAKRINEVIDTPVRIQDGVKEDGDEDKKGSIEFHHVNFKYPEAKEYALEDISFTAKQGETIAIIGSTGCGKSTLVNLIPRFYDVNEGEILVDGINVKDYIQTSLNNKIGYVPQKAVLFRDTVAGNIGYGDNGKNAFDKDDIKNAATVSQAKEFIDHMENGYGTDIAQNGTNVSGGQKQRLSIARAICRKPEIFIFDDTFSALDYKTDRELRSALKKEASNATVILVAQRIGTIMDANKIIVLDEGKMVGIGTHKELLKNCEVYQKIAESQLSKEELA